MAKNKFGNSAEETSRVFDRYGLSEQEWTALTSEQREIHYNRAEKCGHNYAYPGIKGDVSDERLREQYSFDPYAHTTHLLPHRAGDTTCDCQTCDLKFGIKLTGS